MKGMKEMRNANVEMKKCNPTDSLAQFLVLLFISYCLFHKFLSLDRRSAISFISFIWNFIRHQTKEIP
jgi:hypothetical protein